MGHVSGTEVLRCQLAADLGSDRVPIWRSEAKDAPIQLEGWYGKDVIRNLSRRIQIDDQEIKLRKAAR